MSIEAADAWSEPKTDENPIPHIKIFPMEHTVMLADIFFLIFNGTFFQRLHEKIPTVTVWPLQLPNGYFVFSKLRAEEGCIDI